MKYTVEINGKQYVLPARNEAMDKKIYRITGISRLVSSGEITRQESLKEQYDFVSECVPEAMPEYSEIDVCDLEIACMEILDAYNAPVLRAKVEAMTDSLRAIVNKPEVKKLLLLAESAKNASQQ